MLALCFLITIQRPRISRIKKASIKSSRLVIYVYFLSVPRAKSKVTRMGTSVGNLLYS